MERNERIIELRFRAFRCYRSAHDSTDRAKRARWTIMGHAARITADAIEAGHTGS